LPRTERNSLWASRLCMLRLKVAKPHAGLPCLNKCCPHALSQDLAFEDGEHGHPRFLEARCTFTGPPESTNIRVLLWVGDDTWEPPGSKSHAFLKDRITGQNLFAPPTPAETEACPCGT
jgi:hypothetical protein